MAYPARRYRTHEHLVGNWGLGALILGAFGMLLWFYVFTHPDIIVIGHTIMVTQGILYGALVVSAYFWLIAEALTGPGYSYWDLGLRFGLAIIAGSIVGGAIAFLANPGAYLIIPALSGNWLALAMLVAAFYASACALWGAARMHTMGPTRRRGA